MAITYKKLFHLLIDREMTPAQLQMEAGYSPIYPQGSAVTTMYHWSPWKRYVVC